MVGCEADKIIKQLDEAYTWICCRRNRYSANADVWDLRFNWPDMKMEIIRQLNTNTYDFDPVSTFWSGGKWIEMWSARDALVLKALSLALTKDLSQVISRCCYHFKNRGGTKAAIRSIGWHCPNYRFFIKTDVKSYYASMDHLTILEICRKHIKNRLYISLIHSFLNRITYCRGQYTQATRGIPRGSSLSPVLGALYLHELDCGFEKKKHLKYSRYMDDILILCRTRHQTGRIVKGLYQAFDRLKLSMAREKKAIGKTSKGFDFLEYHVRPNKIDISTQSIKKFTGRILERLYQPKADFCQLFQYAGNWLRYFGSGLNKGTFNKQKENLNWKLKLSLNCNLMIALRMP